VNGHRIYDVGDALLSKFHGIKFSEVKSERSDCIKNFSAHSKVKVRDENKTVDLLILFKRIAILKKVTSN